METRLILSPLCCPLHRGLFYNYNREVGILELRYTDEELIEALTKAGGNKRQAAKLLDFDERNFRRRISNYENQNGPINIPPPVEKSPLEYEFEIASLANQVKTLQRELSKAKQDTLSAEEVRRYIFGLSKINPCPPPWIIEAGKSGSSVSVPVLFLSDWHWGETVSREEVGGVNEYNLSIAKERAKVTLQHATDILLHDMPNPNYPGIVIPLGGDMVSGDIHQELSVTNESPIGPIFVDLFNELITFITNAADRFGKVFCPCVAGNHGRMTRKPVSKQRYATNWDWLLCTMLEAHFNRDDKYKDIVKFYVPPTPNALFNILGYRFLLNHGDEFRGGDSMIGALGPIIRGDKKKRSKGQSINQAYDYLLIGHWHQLIYLENVIVNDTLKGYDEYANTQNFPYGKPKQALFLVHPKYGVTHRLAVHAENLDVPVKEEKWVSIF